MNLISSDKPIETRVVAIESELEERLPRFQDLYLYINSINKKRKKVFLSIILPVYNEEKAIKNVLDHLPSNDDIEIIVVNDHSIDHSLAEIRKVQHYKNIRIINHRKNRGYGAAILTGIRHARGEIMVTMDSDGQHSPDDILTLIRPIIEKEADYTIGSRYLGTYFYNLPVSTRLGEVLLEKFIQILFHKKIKNNQNGFRAFNRKVLSIFHDIKYEGYAFCTEQILKVSLEGYKIKECPIKLYDRKFGSSHIILRKLAVNIFSCIFIYYLRKIQFVGLKRNKAGDLKIQKSPKIIRPYKKSITYEKLTLYDSLIFIDRKNFLSA
ncbi:MAG: glycosyltransferase family 2 protein [Promethearchaeota archaeon]|nr:MAG: glycosyltransferase family 2 protein [Candidatus Lokiarchaeota archaeon]